MMSSGSGWKRYSLVMISKKTLKKWFGRNWIAKIASLLLAIALWFLINGNLDKAGNGTEDDPDPAASER